MQIYRERNIEMVLYHVLSAYQLLECIEHRKIIHKNEKAILLIYNFMKERYPHYEELKKYELFDEIYIYPHWKISFSCNLNVAVEAEKVFLSTLPYKIEEFSKIYIAGIHVAFTTFLISKNIRFSIFEDGSGALSRPEVLETIEKKGDPTKYKVISEYGLYYPCNFTKDLVDEKYCDMKAQIPGYYDELAKNFNVVDNFSKLEKETQKKILYFFRCPQELNFNEDTVLLLTQHFSNLRQLSFEEHVYIYQVIFDYFLENKKVIVKLHPDDNMYYEKLFSNITIIREKFPSELLPFIFKKRPRMIATITSTGINAIQMMFKEKLMFTPQFEKSFKFIRKYYAAVRICKLLKADNIYFSGIDQSIIDNLFLKNKLFQQSYKMEKINIFDDSIEEKDWNNMENSNNIFIFLNTSKSYCFYEYELKNIFMKFIPIVITVHKNREEDNFFVENEVIYVFSNNEEVRKKLKKFEYEKTEESSGNLVRVQQLTDEQRKIKILEGMLEATEKRLLYYKESYEKLKEENN